MKMITWECEESDCGGTVNVPEDREAGSCPICDGPMHETVSYED